MSAFVRWVENLPGLLEAGADSKFYDTSSRDYLALPRNMADRVNKLCLAAGTEVAYLKQHEVPGGQPDEVFAFDLGAARGRKKWTAFVDQLAKLIAHDVQKAAKGVGEASVMNRSCDDAFDTMTDCAFLRAGLMRISAKERGQKAGVLLIVDP